MTILYTFRTKALQLLLTATATEENSEQGHLHDFIITASLRSPSVNEELASRSINCFSYANTFEVVRTRHQARENSSDIPSIRNWWNRIIPILLKEARHKLYQNPALNIHKLKASHNYIWEAPKNKYPRLRFYTKKAPVRYLRQSEYSI